MKENKLKILLLYRELIPSIILCGHSQFSYLEKQGEIEYKAISVSKVKASDINWSDALILGRLDSYYERKLTEIASKANKYLIYMIDDDLLNLPDYISCAPYFNQKEIKDNVSFMLNISDAIISPSPILLEKYGKGKVKIKVEEPIIYPFEYETHDLDKPIKIGFAGSIDRIADLDLLYEVLKKIKFKYKERVQIEFFGAIPSFAKELEANCYKYSDSYKGYIDKLHSLNWDIGLAPLPDSDFHKCKHYIKMIEYTGNGIYPIYSNNGPYLRFNKLFNVGTMCANDKNDWIKAIEQLIDNKTLLEKKRQEANEKMCGLFSVKKCSEELKKQLDEKVIITKSSNNVFANLALLKIEGFFKRGISFAQSRASRVKMPNININQTYKKNN